MILGKQCLCCKHCSECKELKKIIADIGFDIYLYVKNPREGDNKYDLLESQGFVLKNIHDFAITSNDLLRKIESNKLKCQRCKTILQHISNAIKGQSIEKNEIFVICDCCIGKGPNYGVKCRQCHKIYNKLVPNEKIQDDVTNVIADSWVSKIRHLLNSKRETRRFLQSLEINKDEYPREHLPPRHIYTKSEQKSITDILQSIKHMQNVSKVKKDPHEIGHDLAHISHTKLPQQVETKSPSKSITDILKKVPEETFKYVFPSLETDTKDLKEYVSSSTLIKEIRDKINLLRGRKKEVFEETKITQKITQAEKSYNAKTAQEKRESKSKSVENQLIKRDEKKDKESKIDKSKTGQQIKKLPQMKKDMKEDMKKDMKKDLKKDMKEDMKKGLKEDMKKDNVAEVDTNKKESKQVKDKTTKKPDKISNGVPPTPKIKKNTQEISKVAKDDSLMKAIKEAKNNLKTQKESEKGAKSPPTKSINLSRIKVKKDSLDEEHIGMIKMNTKPEPERKLPQLPDVILTTIKKREPKITGEESDFDELDELFLKKKPVEDNEVIIGQKIFKFKTPFIDKIDKEFSKNKEVQPLLFNSTFNDNDPLDTQPSEDTDNRISLVMKQKESPSVKPATLTAFGHLRNAGDNVNYRNQYKERDKKYNYEPIESISFSRIKFRNASIDDEHIKLVKIKQSAITESGKGLTQLADLNIPQQTLQKHQTNFISEDSELEIAVDELLQKNPLCENSDVVVGGKILKSKTPFISKLNANKTVQPLFFETTFNESYSDVLKLEVNDPTPLITENENPAVPKESDQETKGAVRYSLSNRSFIDKGWTMLPTEKIVRKMNVYRMRPSHPEFDWFEHNKSKKHMHYDSGESLAEFQADGRGRIYYRNGKLALDYYSAEEMNAGQRYVVYSNGEPDEKRRPRPVTVLATFDYLGNGIVFDHTGKVRLKYNQTEGVVLDREIGPVSHWKWHELNDPPVLQKIMIDTQMSVKDPEILKLGGAVGNTPRTDNEEMLAIEFDNFIKEKSKKLSQKFKPFQIKMKALKINENFSLKVLDQASVYLLFREGTTNIKLNLGMILDHKEIVDTDTAELGEVTCNLERFPARTDSLAMLQRSVAHAQHVEKLRIDHERRIKVAEETPSVDRLAASISRPLRPLVRNLPEPKCNCNIVKPPICS